MNLRITRLTSQLPRLTALLCLLLSGAATPLQGAADLQVTTFAGLAGAPGQADGTGATARFSSPYGVAVNTSSNVYVADTHNHTIRAITPTRNVSTLAGLPGNPGSADGPGGSAQFNQPYGVAVDTSGTVYVADTLNHTIRKITPAGVVSTVAGLAGNSGSADGPTNIARFSFPKSIAVDTSGNVYVADQGNHTIRRITPDGSVSTLAGLAGQAGSADGTNSTARFFYPDGLAVDSLSTVYVADTANHTIRKITPTGVVSTLAGLAGNSGSADGTNSVARFFYPDGLVVDTSLNVFVADTANHTLRQISPAGAVTTLAGLAGNNGSSDGPAGAARFNYPSGVAVDAAGNLFVADTSNDTVREGIFSSSPLPTRIIGLLGELSFGNVLVGQTAPHTLTITNSGNAPLNVLGISYPAGFSGAWSGSIPPGASTNITVTFAPTATTTYSGLVTVTSDATDGINALSASGTGIPVPTRIIGLSGSLDFGPVQVGHTAARTLTLTNSGNSPLTVSNINYPAGFSGAWSGTIPPSSAQNVTVTFTPSVVADYSGNLSVTSDATAGTSTIAVSGAGTPVLLLQLTGMSFSNGLAGFVLNGPSGNSFVIQISSNLLSWLPFSTNVIPAGGLVAVVDSTAKNDPIRFYRAVLDVAANLINIDATSGVVMAPFVISNNSIYQPIETSATNGGRAAYDFTVAATGNYVIRALVDAPNVGANSFFLTIDAEPLDPYMIWDIPVTAGFQDRVVSWRGNGTNENDQLVPVVFNLTSGAHQLIVRGREGATSLRNLTIAPANDILFQASSGVLTPPFAINDGSVYQPVDTDVVSGGRAVYGFTITNAGEYVIQTVVNAPNVGANSFFLNIDAEPQDPTMIWDISPLTSGFEQRTVSWRGGGTNTSDQFAPKLFSLTPGDHQLIIRGREGYTLLQSVTVLPYP